MGPFRYTIRSFGRELALLVTAAVFAIPLYICVIFSLKGQQDTTDHPLALPAHPTTSAFSTAWQGTSGVTLGHALISSAIITVGSVLPLLVLGSLCAYAIARRPSRLSTGLFLIFVAGLIVPIQIGVTPIYVALRHLHLLDSYLGMILLYTGLLMPLSVFLYTGFIRVLPRDYEEAAQVDGASFLRTFTRVTLPLLRPVTGTVAVLTGIFIWNDFFFPLILLNGSDKETLPVVIYSFVGEYTTQWSLIFAAVLISIGPVFVFYLVAQRQLIRGFAGGIRG